MNEKLQQHLGRVSRFVSAGTGTASAIHGAWMLANLLGINNYKDFNPHGLDSVQDCLVEADALGNREGLHAAEADVPHWFVGTELADAWKGGFAFRREYEEDRGGTQEEWDALSAEEQDASWDSFHDLCASGVGDRHPYYELLMSKHLVDYVGH